MFARISPVKLYDGDDNDETMYDITDIKIA